MEVEQVRMWRPPEEERVLLKAGRTTHYAVEPRGEYVFGVVVGAPMRSRRGRERRVVRPGDVVAWDPSQTHTGTTIDGRPWAARLMVVEAADLAALTSDQDTELPAGLAFPDPVCEDPGLAADFLRLHATLEAPTTRLQAETRLAEWLARLTARAGAVRPARPPVDDRDDRALRLARDYLADHADRNIGLDELATATGVGKFRLIRLFRQRTGLPPHALQIAHRIHTARRMLETGHSIAETATATGFADQSHLHRHFQRTLGITPGEYQKCFHPAGGRTAGTRSERASTDNDPIPAARPGTPPPPTRNRRQDGPHSYARHLPQRVTTADPLG